MKFSFEYAQRDILNSKFYRNLSRFYNYLKRPSNLIILILLLEAYDHIISLTISKSDLKKNILCTILICVIAINIVILLASKSRKLRRTLKNKFRLLLLLNRYRKLFFAIFITVSIYETKFYEINKVEKKNNSKFHLFTAILLILRNESISQIQKSIGLIFSVFYLNFRFIQSKEGFFVSFSDFVFMLMLGLVILFKTEITTLNRTNKAKLEIIYSECNNFKQKKNIDESPFIQTTNMNISILFKLLNESQFLLLVIKNGIEIIYVSKEYSDLFSNGMEDLDKLKLIDEGIKISCFENNNDFSKEGIGRENENEIQIENESQRDNKYNDHFIPKTLKIEDLASVESEKYNSKENLLIKLSKGDSLLKLLDELNQIILHVSNNNNEKFDLINGLKTLFKKINNRLVYLQCETNFTYIIQLAVKDINGDIFLSILLTKAFDEVGINHFNEKVKIFQSKFLKSVSHEMKTPLNAAITLLTSCEDKVQIDNWNLYISPALNSLFILNSSVNDILDYSSLFQKNFDLTKRAISLKSIVKKCYELFSIQVQTREKLSFLLDIEDEIPDIIENDGERIKQILINFLTNSFKFTQSGEIVINVGKVEDEDRFYISVQDTGIGFSMENKNNKFTLNDNENGDFVGLGLRISNKIAKWLNFDKQGLEYYSNSEFTIFKFFISDYSYEFTEGIINVGNQSEYRSHRILNNLEKNNPKFFNFPKKLLDSHRLINIHSLENKNLSENISLRNNRPNTSKVTKDGNEFKSKSRNNSILIVRNCDEMREDEREEYLSNIYSMHESTIMKKCLCPDILIVDDNDFNIYALKLCLQKFNLMIDTAVNGLEAINCVKELSEQNCCKVYKIIFMDFDMPVMNGHDSSKSIKKYLTSIDLDTKIIGCSAFTSEKDVKRCFESGMDDYEPKPLNNEKIEILLAKWYPKKIVNQINF